MTLTNVTEAANRLKNNGIAAIPTETVYGLAARIGSSDAIKQIFSTKKRPSFDPLIVHVIDREQAQTLTTEWPEIIDSLTREFWPGPLTVVVPKNKNVSDLITAGLPTVGLRSPQHPLARELLAELNEPFAAPSANLFTKTSPTKAEHVSKAFGDELMVIDGGPAQVGLESTIVSYDLNKKELQILRPGSISRLHLLNHLKKYFSDWQITEPQTKQISAPGQLNEHYRPRLPLILVKNMNMLMTDLQNQLSEKLSIKTKPTFMVLKLSEDPTLVARELYRMLHDSSQSKATVLVCFVHPYMQTPEWEAIMDRLTRAASLVV